ncbi:ABC transporter permease [Actinocrispum wychmicini]|uniref:Peptide/nickel transport system permease protein n=1 Tax=Actinocrispum wychmicini TaxID=1213861 RepID=A0A4R2JPN1_9PSEU|nr:ABC transporter permease [Actinocrispum wychmicini]TCO60732.1 peptide/nickel transport system permease protein [Actinocrispum wychmicini]
MTDLVAVRSYNTEVRGRLFRDPAAVVCLLILAALVFAAIAAPLLTSYDPLQVSVTSRLLPVGSSGHVLGTDELGRDVLSRLLHGGRLSLLTGIVPILVATVVGTLLGAVIAYVGGPLSSALARALDMSYAFPAILIGIAVTASLGPGTANSIIALSIAFIPPIARVAESATRQVVVQEYIEAARLSGARWHRIILSQILPNVFGPVFVYASGMVGLSISVGAGLSFLGLGTPPPTPEWGSMLNSLRASIYVQPLVVALPGLFIFLASVAFNVLSDSLRDALDVREG